MSSQIICAINLRVMNELANKSERLDTIAVVLSCICMLHCLALPIVLTAFPILNITTLSENVFHLLMMVVILPVSIFALTIGCRKHKDALTLTLGAIGLGTLMTTAFFGHDLFGLSGERIATSIGGLILAAAHIQNYRCCRQDNCTHDH